VLAPVKAKDRYDAMDVLRGFALCGILLMNILAMGTPWATYYPSFPASWSDPSWHVWFAENVFFEGTMRGLFTFLFGAAVILITQRGDQEGRTMGAADVWFRRCLVLLALGFINFTLLLWPGDILWNYGCAGLFLFVFRKARPRTLLILALTIMALLSIAEGLSEQGSVQNYRDGLAAHQAQLAGQTLSSEQQKALQAYAHHQQRLSPPQAELDEEAAQRLGPYPDAVAWSFNAYSEWGMNGWGIFMILESIGFMLMGMALFKWRVITGERSMGFYLAMTGLGYGVGVSLNVAEHLAIWNSGFSPEVWWPNYTYELSRLPTTLGHLGLIMVLWKGRSLFFVGTGLRAIGKMALTNYLGQSLIAAIIFYGLGWANHLTWAELWLLCVPIWIAQAIFSVIWLQRYEYGPLEWGLRAIAYGERPTMRRVSSA